MVDRVGDSGVLSHAAVGKVDPAILIQGDVLKQGIPSDGVVDVRFALLIQVDDLCIAAAFEVEDTVVIPAVFIITDEKSLRIGGKGGLARSGKAEEDCGVLTVHIGVGGAVHGCDSLKGQVVVHH